MTLPATLPGIAPAIISIEKGSFDPGIPPSLRIAEKFGIHIEDVLTPGLLT